MSLLFIYFITSILYLLIPNFQFIPPPISFSELICLYWLWNKPLDESKKIFFLKDIIAVLSSVQSLSHVQLFATPWTTARQASLSIVNSWSLLKLRSIESVISSNHLIHCHPSSYSQSFPASGSFQMSQFFASGGQSIRVSASASVLPVNIQDWFPLGWIGWISLQSKGLSRAFSNNTVQKYQFFGSWKNHSFVIYLFML